jgi:hypothetical protein
LCLASSTGGGGPVAMVLGNEKRKTYRPIAVSISFRAPFWCGFLSYTAQSCFITSNIHWGSRPVCHTNIMWSSRKSYSSLVLSCLLPFLELRVITQAKDVLFQCQFDHFISTVYFLFQHYITVLMWLV